MPSGDTTLCAGQMQPRYVDQMPCCVQVLARSLRMPFWGGLQRAGAQARAGAPLLGTSKQRVSPACGDEVPLGDAASLCAGRQGHTAHTWVESTEDAICLQRVGALGRLQHVQAVAEAPTNSAQHPVTNTSICSMQVPCAAHLNAKRSKCSSSSSFTVLVIRLTVFLGLLALWVSDSRLSRWL